MKNLNRRKDVALTVILLIAVAIMVLDIGCGEKDKHVKYILLHKVTVETAKIDTSISWTYSSYGEVFTDTTIKRHTETFLVANCFYSEEKLDRELRENTQYHDAIVIKIFSAEQKRIEYEPIEYPRWEYRLEKDYSNPNRLDDSFILFIGEREYIIGE